MGILDHLRRIRKYSKQGSSDMDRPAYVGFSGGDGSSPASAVVIHAPSSLDGVQAEYAYITRKHGEKNAGWKLEMQSLLEKDGKHFDAMSIILTDGSQLKYYFDISEFYGKF